MTNPDDSFVHKMLGRIVFDTYDDFVNSPDKLLQLCFNSHDFVPYYVVIADVYIKDTDTVIEKGHKLEIEIHPET